MNRAPLILRSFVRRWRRALDGQEAAEEGAVAAEGQAQVFGGYVFAFVPLRFELAALFGENLG